MLNVARGCQLFTAFLGMYMPDFSEKLDKMEKQAREYQRAISELEKFDIPKEKKIKMNFIQIILTIAFLGLIFFWFFSFRKIIDLYMKKERGYKRKIINVYLRAFLGLLVFVIVFVFLIQI